MKGHGSTGWRKGMWQDFQSCALTLKEIPYVGSLGVNKILVHMHVRSLNVLCSIDAMNDRPDHFAQQGCSHILTWENSAV